MPIKCENKFYCRWGFNPYPANVDNMATPTNASKWRMGFNSAFKGFKEEHTALQEASRDMPYPPYFNRGNW